MSYNVQWLPMGITLVEEGRSINAEGNVGGRIGYNDFMWCRDHHHKTVISDIQFPHRRLQRVRRGGKIVVVRF